MWRPCIVQHAVVSRALRLEWDDRPEPVVEIDPPEDFDAEHYMAVGSDARRQAETPRRPEMTADSGPASVDAVLDRFFTAIAAADIKAVEDLYHPDVEVWLNVTDQTINRTQSLGVLRWFTDRLVGMRYEIIERRTWDGGAVQRHVVHGQVGDQALTVPACIVFHLAQGRIIRLYEYLDGKDTMAVFGISEEQVKRLPSP
jgi:ketosteroid isomerase-like protein